MKLAVVRGVLEWRRRKFSAGRSPHDEMHKLHHHAKSRGCFLIKPMTRVKEGMADG